MKICGLSKTEHVQAAVAAGADAVGFVFAESVRRVDPSHAAAIANEVPDTIKKVAVMLHPTNEEWQAVLRDFSPDVLQTDAEDFAGLDVPDAKSGQGETVDWSRAAEIAQRGDMILAGGLGAHNVAEAIATVRPFGVDVSSAVESAPGEKDPQMIREFVTAARAAEKNR